MVLEREERLQDLDSTYSKLKTAARTEKIHSTMKERDTGYSSMIGSVWQYVRISRSRGSELPYNADTYLPACVAGDNKRQAKRAKSSTDRLYLDSQVPLEVIDSGPRGHDDLLTSHKQSILVR
jgi:hypothetical protein